MNENARSVHRISSEEARKLATLQNEYLRKKFNASKQDVYLLKKGLRIYDTITDENLTIEQKSEKENTSKYMIYGVRSALIRYGLITPSLNNKQKTGNVKKLISQRHRGKLSQRYINFNIPELKAANLEPEKEYYAIVEPAEKTFTIRFFVSTQEAKKYKSNKLQT